MTNLNMDYELLLRNFGPPPAEEDQIRWQNQMEKMLLVVVVARTKKNYWKRIIRSAERSRSTTWWKRKSVAPWNGGEREKCRGQKEKEAQKEQTDKKDFRGDRMGDAPRSWSGFPPKHSSAREFWVKSVGQVIVFQLTVLNIATQVVFQFTSVQQVLVRIFHHRSLNTKYIIVI